MSTNTTKRALTSVESHASRNENIVEINSLSLPYRSTPSEGHTPRIQLTLCRPVFFPWTHRGSRSLVVSGQPHCTACGKVLKVYPPTEAEAGGIHSTELSAAHYFTQRGLVPWQSDLALVTETAERKTSITKEITVFDGPVIGKKCRKNELPCKICDDRWCSRIAGIPPPSVLWALLKSNVVLKFVRIIIVIVAGIMIKPSPSLERRQPVSRWSARGGALRLPG